MNKDWVKEKTELRQKEIKRIEAKIISKLEATDLLDEDDVASFISNIRRSVQIGFSSPRFMFSHEVYEKYKEFYSKIHNEEQATLSIVAFHKKIMDVLDTMSAEFSTLYEEEHKDYESYLDSDPVMFDGDIIITDPCYVTRENSRDDYYDFKSVGVEHSMVRDTIYGDWSCTTFNADTGEVLGEFCADAGMVSVLSLDEILRYNPKFDYHTTKPWTTTLIRDFKGSVRFVIKESKWTLDKDTSYGKAGDEFTDYYVEVVGKGINKKTGEQLNFVGKQTGL